MHTVLLLLLASFVLLAVRAARAEAAERAVSRRGVASTPGAGNGR